MWVCGGLVIGVGVYLLIHLLLGRYVDPKVFKGYNQGKWWQYLLTVVIISIGCLFLAAGRIRLYTFNKKTNKFSILKTSILCCHSSQTYKLS